MAQMTFLNTLEQESRRSSIDSYNELTLHTEHHYVGIDVGTGSARACIINSKGDIIGLDSENIGLWQPEPGYYVRVDCWRFGA